MPSTSARCSRRPPRRALRPHGDDPAARAAAETRLGTRDRRRRRHRGGLPRAARLGALRAAAAAALAERGPDRARAHGLQRHRADLQQRDRGSCRRASWPAPSDSTGATCSSSRTAARETGRVARPRARSRRSRCPPPRSPTRASRSRAAFVNVTLARSGEVLVREDLTFDYSGFFTGAYRDIPLATDVTAGDVQVSEGGTAVRAGRQHDARQQRRPRHASARCGMPAGPAHRLALPAGRRRADVHAALPPARRRHRPRRRRRGGAAGLGRSVEERARPPARERARRRRGCPARAPGSSRPGSSTASPCAAATYSAAVDDVPAGRAVILRVLYPPSVLAPDAPYARHVHDNVLAATIAREEAAAARAERDKPRARGHAPPPVGVDPRGRRPGDRSRRAARRASRTGASAASTRPARAPEYVHEPPDDLPPALVPSLLAQRVVAGGDQLAATLFELVRRGRFKMTPRDARGVVVRRPAPQGDRRRRPRARRREHRAGRRREARGRDLRPAHDRGARARSRRSPSIVKELPQADRDLVPRRSEAFESAIRNQARQRIFWSGHGMLVKWLAFAAFLLAGGGLLALGIAGLADPPLVRRDLIITAVGAALALNAVVVLLLPAPMWRRRRPALQASAERWEGFRHYLEDFPRLADKPADTLPLWESYLIYGITFGIAERVLEAARVVVPGDLHSSVYVPALYVSSFSTVELRERPRRRVPVALERELGRRRWRRLVRRRWRRRLVTRGRSDEEHRALQAARRRGRRRRRSGACWPATARAPSRSCASPSGSTASPGRWRRRVATVAWSACSRRRSCAATPHGAAAYARAALARRGRVADRRLRARARLPRSGDDARRPRRPPRRWPPAARRSSARPPRWRRSPRATRLPTPRRCAP